jgi:hypothetical protein
MGMGGLEGGERERGWDGEGGSPHVAGGELRKITNFWFYE